MGQMTLNKWFFKNTKLPLLFLGITIAFVQVGFIFYTHNKSKENQRRAIQSFVSTIAHIGIQQGNRPLLESSLQLAVEELGVKSLFVCQGSRKLFHQPLGFGNCSDFPKIGLFESVIQITPSGFKDYRLYFYVNRFHVNPSLIGLNVIILIVLFVIFHLIYKIQRKLSNDILLPLENNLSCGEEFNIKELNIIREKFEEYRHSKEKQAIAGAILEHNISIGHNMKSIRQTLHSIMRGEFSSEKQKKKFNQMADDFKSLTEKIVEQIPENDKMKLITSEETFFEYLQKENKKRTKSHILDIFEVAVDHKKIEIQRIEKAPSIEFSCRDEVRSSFVEVIGPELRSIMSNLMNNAMEAHATHINIRLHKEGKDLVCRVSDNGIGIPEEVKSDIFGRGFTWGKEKGTGYGLYHAKHFIESWSGSLDLLESQKETEFEIRLPIWKSPIRLESIKNIVILDDEESVHERWSEKVSLHPNANVIAFKKPDEFQNWFDTQEVFSDHMFFFDSDLGSKVDSGEHLIDKLGINQISYLVTNNYDNSDLIAWCNKRSIQVIPKESLLG